MFSNSIGLVPYSFTIYSHIAGLFLQKNKIEDTLQMTPPTVRKLIQSLLGILNYYCGLHPASEINMQHLLSFTSPKVKFK